MSIYQETRKKADGFPFTARDCRLARGSRKSRKQDRRKRHAKAK